MHGDITDSTQKSLFIFLIKDPLSVSKSEYPDSKVLLNITFFCLYPKRMFSRGK